jgi:Flp pilus assembly protein TadD
LAERAAARALAYLSAAGFSAPKDPDIQYHLAVSLDRLGRTAEARAMLETLLGSDVTFSDRADPGKLLQQLKRG